VSPLAIDLRLTAWTLVTFAGLLVVLARYAFKPLRRILDERESRIRESLEKAETARQEAQAVLQKNEEHLEQARSETRRIIGEGHRIVAEMKREAQKTAKEEADRIVSEARLEIEREMTRGVGELKDTVANLSLRIARQVIKEGLDEKRHREVVEEFLARVRESHARREP
jgi:F-type H+-transporting ATPase subunit b